MGTHIIAEFFCADYDALNNADEIEKAMIKGVEVAGAHSLSSHKHFFEPHGVSAVVIVMESNLCIHTWPEFGYAAADFFTCGSTVKPWKAFDILKESLQAKRYNCMELQRGIIELINNPLKVGQQVQRPQLGVQQRHQCCEQEKHLDMTVVMETDEVLVSKQTQFQKLEIVRNKFWGNTMYLDDVLNVTERDEFVYHEMIVHVPMMMHPNPKRVLIVGGGDGGAAREVLRHPNLEKVVMIDIDGDVVEECRKHMPGISAGAFEDKRLELIIGDGIDYVMKAENNSFDVIVVDSTDPTPEGCGEVLFTTEFYSNVKRILADNGVMTNMNGLPMRYQHNFMRGLRVLQDAFTPEKTWVYLVGTDCYNGNMSMGCCWKGGSPPDENLDEARIKEFTKLQKLKHYNFKLHKAAFALPNFVKDLLKFQTRT